MDKFVSIIVRTKNEERWIAQVLDGIFSQAYKDFEVILVDNESCDKTIEKARQFNLSKIITCRDYMPGKALNMGIRQARGTYVACLSGHCIPVGDRWLSNLVRNFGDPMVAGVYGRQEPMAFTPDSDKRDLALVFGLDRKEQVRDSFFHNANSMIRREIWKETPFDNVVTNIEDRVWAKEVLRKGYRIIYEPESSVYHYHGIHQNGDVERCSSVVRIMETLHGDYEYKALDIEKMNVVAFIPVRGEVRYLGGKPLLQYTVEQARASKYIKKVIVSTDNEDTAALAKSVGAETPFLRDRSFSRPDVDLAKVLRHSLEKTELAGIFPDIVVCMEITFPFRPKDLIDNMIAQLAENGFDSVVAARLENKTIWQERDGRIGMITDGIVPRELKEPVFIELKGVGCVTHPEFLRGGRLMGSKIGIYELKNPYSHLEVRDEEDIKMASMLADSWFLRE